MGSGDVFGKVWDMRDMIDYSFIESSSIISLEIYNAIYFFVVLKSDYRELFNILNKDYNENGVVMRVGMI